MRTAHLLPVLALAWVTASAMGPVSPIAIPQPRFQSYSELFAWIAAERSLGDPYDEHLIQQIQADSRIDRVRDRSAAPIAVVRVELLNPDGTSRARSQDGNFPFYVLRESSAGMVLMGRMFGRAYTSRMHGRNLEFQVELHPSAVKTVVMHFRVEDNRLINLSAPPHRFEDVFARRAD
jgi:hypothetical protein